SPAAPTTPSAAESSAPTSAPEHDPVKGGDWAKLSPELQTQFSRLAAEPWATMDQMTFIESFDANPTLSHQFALYLYNNNVSSTLARVVAKYPRDAATIEAAQTITSSSPANNGEAMLLNAELWKTVAYDIGQTDPDAGAFLIGQVFAPDGSPFVAGMANYQASLSSEQPYDYSVDAAMKPAVATYDQYTNAGLGGGLVVFGDVLSGNDNSRQERRYLTSYGQNPISNETTFMMSLGLVK
ncbi:MAG TPA: hypothetical protein VIJ25_00555, partial [Methylococcales bacterium]